MSNNIYYDYDEKYRNIGQEFKEDPLVKNFFSKNTVDPISKMVTKMLNGVDEYGREIIVPDNRILEVMNSVYYSYNPRNGFDSAMSHSEYFDSLVGQTISRIVYDVKNTLQYESCMNKKNIWTTLLDGPKQGSVEGEFNESGLRSYAPIKLKNKRPNSFEFNMKY